MKRSIRKNKGFTLIELLIVVAILGILAVISVRALNNANYNNDRDPEMIGESIFDD